MGGGDKPYKLILFTKRAITPIKCNVSTVQVGWATVEKLFVTLFYIDDVFKNSELFCNSIPSANKVLRYCSFIKSSFPKFK